MRPQASSPYPRYRAGSAVPHTVTPAVAQRRHVKERCACRRDQQFQLRQALNDASRNGVRSRIAATISLSASERTHHRHRRRESAPRRSRCAGADRRPIRHIERDAL